MLHIFSFFFIFINWFISANFAYLLSKYVSFMHFLHNGLVNPLFLVEFILISIITKLVRYFCFLLNLFLSYFTTVDAGDFRCLLGFFSLIAEFNECQLCISK